MDGQICPSIFVEIFLKGGIQMKKVWLTIILIAIVVIVTFVAIPKKQVLYIYNWEEYIPEEVIKSFEEKYNCEIVYDSFASNEEMYAKIKAGGGGYDVVFPSGDHVSIMKKEGLLLKLDHSKIPNLKYLDKEILKKMSYDPNQEYSVPYMMDSTGICVNKKYVKDYEHSWNIFEVMCFWNFNTGLIS